MSKIKLKCKILINGLYPMHKYKIDEFTQKTGTYNEKLLDVENPDYIFYAAGHMVQSMYAVKEKKGIFYEYFENDDYIEIEIDDKIYKNSKEIQKYVLDMFYKKIGMLEKRLRLITNICIGLPVFNVNIYNEEEKFITKVGGIPGKTSNLRIATYTDKMKEILSERTRFNIISETLEKLENENDRYKRAINFYNDSFYVEDIGIKFTLLFSALETLFNLNGRFVKRTIAKYASKILFLSTEKEKEINDKLKDFYRIRSNYIHGNEPISIEKEIEFELREIVRKVLLIYWLISNSNKKVKTPKEMINYLDNNTKDSIDLQLQIFIKALDMKEYSDFYEDIREKLQKGITTLL